MHVSEVDGKGLGLRGEGELEKYSLEHVESIRDEGQRANSIPYLCKSRSIALVIRDIARVKQVGGTCESKEITDRL